MSRPRKYSLCRGHLPETIGGISASNPSGLTGMATIPTGCIMRGMKWKADRTTMLAAFALVVGGFARIAFAHDLVLGGASIGLGIIIAVRVFLYFRTPGA